ncbi:FtsK/SpoIIIE domain-containing protein [Streptococcus equi subsp. zooepidemicus]|uniref:FtsK/SpoIIIE domain-containing protein n=1 Tax=Streptococcus TaxID=1301 RepID=UPI001CF3D6BE|nr:MULTISPECIES: FtsK/SpoIIIE domain-containing protein [Streptococcus]HEL1631391.1 cell division protein FtsK [Streptococcus suis]MCB2834449.1 cell division protein FtsK [Streptococcus dysgalactiae subsp. dysgalactiae]MDI6044863.1 FtsK/SpoIIIE domain-containing protein [Streptococcus equi subsp. zooepidemicus]HEL1965249.1 cell division protein FtsK [Streptococcus suis]HEL1967800.1 cell division protein FtsK [Streptococcus suis]
MHLFTYRGLRVRKIYSHIRVITCLLMLLPFLIGNGFYYYPIYELIIADPIFYAPKIALTLLPPLLIVPLINLLLYQKVLFFQRLNTLRIMTNFLLENRYYLSKTIKREGKTIEKIVLPRVYVKRGKYQLLASFILEGNKFQDRFINLGATLEVMFNGDFRNKTFDNRFVTYEIAINRIASRINVSEVTMTDKGLRLMKDVFWDYIAEPHLLISGGTGGGKTVVLMTIVWALAKIGFIDLCDPKNADLAGLKAIPVFKGRVFTSKEDIIACLKDNVTFMEDRYEAIQNRPDYKIGKNFSDYGLKPKFIVIDEWAAFIAKIENDYHLQAEATEYLSQIVLEGRQSGVFVIFAMQRPDGEYIKTALRDNFMKRLSVGHLEDTGYTMMFGDANRNKEFKKLDKINGKKVHGRGYIANNGELAGEFFSPYVPFDKGFSFEEEFRKLPVLDEDEAVLPQDRPAPADPGEKASPKEKTIAEILEENRLLTDFAKEHDLTVKTLRKIIYLLDERGVPFDKVDNALVVTPFQEQLLLETLGLFEAEGRKSYPKAVDSCLANHGLGQEQGQA